MSSYAEGQNQTASQSFLLGGTISTATAVPQVNRAMSMRHGSDKLLFVSESKHKCPESSPITCPSIEKKAGLVQGTDKPSNIAQSLKTRYRFVEVDNTLQRITPSKGIKNEKKELSSMKPPTVLPTMSGDEVKRRTGFRGASALLAYIIAIRNGNFDRILRGGQH